jgi:hypothetical protein
MISKLAGSNHEAALKAALGWWRSQSEPARKHLKRVSGLKSGIAIMRYWLQVVATPHELTELGL